MKKIFYLTFFCIAFSTIFSSCSDRKTYAQRLKEESKLIQSYISRNGIKVLNKFPADSVSFGEKEFVKLSSGVYFRLAKKGDEGSLNVQANDNVTVRYIEYALTPDGDVTNHWDINSSPYPQTFKYLKLDESCRAFHEAIGYMKKNNAEAQLIVPSKWGFGDNFNANTLSPYGYNLVITLRDNTIPKD